MGVCRTRCCRCHDACNRRATHLLNYGNVTTLTEIALLLRYWRKIALSNETANSFSRACVVLVGDSHRQRRRQCIPEESGLGPRDNWHWHFDGMGERGAGGGECRKTIPEGIKWPFYGRLGVRASPAARQAFAGPGPPIWRSMSHGNARGAVCRTHLEREPCHFNIKAS